MPIIPNVARIGMIIAALAGSLLLAGCAPAVGGGGSGNDGDHPTPTGRSIIGTWKLAGGSDAAGAMSLDGAAVTLTINGAKSGGSGPCNGYGATASSATTGPIRLKRGIATTMACVPNDRNILEARYFAALGKITNASMIHGRLILTGAGDTLEFARPGT